MASMWSAVGFLFVLSLGGFFGFIGAQDPRENPSQFFQNLLKDYDKLRRPGPTSEPTIVTISMYIMKVEEIDLHSETMSFNAYVRFSWIDERLRHNWPTALMLTDASMVSKVWEPDMFIENAQQGEYHYVPTPNVFMKIQGDGQVKISKRLSMKVHCDENLGSFPMDTVTCSVAFSTYGSTLETIRMKGLEADGTNKGFGIADKVVPVGYEYVDMAVEEEEKHFGSGSYGAVKVHIHFQRLRGGFVVTTFLPCMGFVILSYLSLFVDTREVGTKLVFNAILLGITYYLSNSIHMIVPRVSQLTAMDYYLGTTCFILFWVMAASVFLDTFNGPDAKIPYFNGPADLWISRVELVTKFGIPLFYLLFQVVFWITYLT